MVQDAKTRPGGLRAIRKTWRFLTIYGVGKTLFKVFGRLRPKRLSAGSGRKGDIGLIGCGQFAYATMGYSLWRKFGNRFAACYDIDPGNQRSFARFFGLPDDAASAQAIIDDPRVRYVYIASNHASHTDYALAAMAAGKTVYMEKPVSVNVAQLARLIRYVRDRRPSVFAGYNRPFSAAVRQLRTRMAGVDTRSPLTLNCFISGHQIGPDHWYRRPEEGTRVCGNVGHWLDLAVHMLRWGELPDRWEVSIAYSSQAARDDDMAIALTSERGDLVNIVLTARSEPFEGINETINFQQGEVIAKIDDFRRMTVWKGDRVFGSRFWPKDVGHNQAIIQPFSELSRDWAEVELSSVLMLFIADMVIRGERSAPFSFSTEFNKLFSQVISR